MAETINKKTAIVTGGGSGIGLAITEKFIENGIFTVVIGRDKTKLEQIEDRFGDMVLALSYDLSDLSGIPELVASITERCPRIDILVNNAGINMKKNFIEVTDEDFEKIIRTNLVSVFAMTREVVKSMLPNKKGCIINISSMAAAYGLPRVVAYTASKSAIEGITKSLAVELGPDGIRVNAIAPGFIKTEMSETALKNDEERRNKVMGRTPLGYLGSSDDVAEAALYLALDSSRYVTGISLKVDGGNSIGF